MVWRENVDQFSVPTGLPPSPSSGVPGQITVCMKPPRRCQKVTQNLLSSDLRRRSLAWLSHYHELDCAQRRNHNMSANTRLVGQAAARRDETGVHGLRREHSASKLEGINKRLWHVRCERRLRGRRQPLALIGGKRNANIKCAADSTVGAEISHQFEDSRQLLVWKSEQQTVWNAATYWTKANTRCLLLPLEWKTRCIGGCRLLSMLQLNRCFKYWFVSIAATWGRLQHF